MFAIRFEKERFKFSAAHFTILGPRLAERLHGHNYQVALTVYVKSLDSKTALAVDFKKVKSAIDKVCQKLDERILIPQASSYLKLLRRGKNMEVSFGPKLYSFPLEDIKLLMIQNITCEALCQFITIELRKALKTLKRCPLEISVSESSGQSCLMKSGGAEHEGILEKGI